MTRLTAELVIEKFGRRIDELTAMKCNDADWMASGIDYAAGVVAATLGSRWQDEPDADDTRPHWVEGLSDRMPVLLYRSDDGRWLMSGAIPLGDVWVEVDGEELDGRRVCPIGERPQGGVQ
jgi:hypothetical protein